ncbi:MAG: hypothetical protein WKF30_02485 [Pyrinomonadaceae bacterium]
MTATEFSYGAAYNQVTEVRDYDYGGINLLRKTVNEYENGTNYTNNHIFNLVKSVSVYASDGSTRVSLTEYQYDGEQLKNTLESRSWTPHTIRTRRMSNNAATRTTRTIRTITTPAAITIRATATSAKSTSVTPQTRTSHPLSTAVTSRNKTYANAAAEPASSEIIETRTYDITGNLVTASTACCEQTSFNYALSTQYAYPSSQTSGAVDPNSPARVASSGTYDFNTGLNLSTTDANNLTSQTVYYPQTLRPQTALLPQALTRHLITTTTR